MRGIFETKNIQRMFFFSPEIAAYSKKSVFSTVEIVLHLKSALSVMTSEYFQKL